MANLVLANWIGRGLRVINLLSVVGFTIFVGIFCLAILTSLGGGKIGTIKMFVEWRVLIPMTLSGCFHSLALFFIGTQLLEITKSQIAGDPFIPQNGTRIRKIAIILAALEISRYLVQIITGLIIAFAGQPQDGTISTKLSANFMVWGAIIIILLLSEIFKEGARLRQNDQLTI
jgi:Protein of unknown function (DUF2975)